MSKDQNGRLRRLCRAIVREAVESGHADLWDRALNPSAHVELTLTVAELRVAANFINYHPTGEELKRAAEAREWANYLAELDGVE